MSKMSSSSSSSLGRELGSVATKDELKKMLECPVCLDIPLPPIYQCKSGHIICDDCKKKVKKCGVCQQAFTNCRNFPLENIVESSSFRCDYREYGCDKMIPGLQLKKHLQECKFGPIKCHLGTLDNCKNSVIKISDYFDHHKNVHRASTIDHMVDGKGSCVYMLNLPWRESGIWPFGRINFDGKWFLTYTFGSGPIVCFCTLIFGDETEAAAYSVQILYGMERPMTCDNKFYTTFPVFPIRKYKEELSHLRLAMLNEGALRSVGTIVSDQGREKIQCRVHYKITKNSPAAT